MLNVATIYLFQLYLQTGAGDRMSNKLSRMTSNDKINTDYAINNLAKRSTSINFKLDSIGLHIEMRVICASVRGIHAYDE